MSTTVRAKLLAHGQGLPLPAYRSEGASGMDLHAALPGNMTVVIEPGARERVPTGIALELPEGVEAQVRPRSGLAHRHGVTVLNAPGTIDADYRGEIEVVLINHGQSPFEVRRGTRIAQIVFSRFERAALVAADELGATGRGAGGFGSTGLHEGEAPKDDGGEGR